MTNYGEKKQFITGNKHDSITIKCTIEYCDDKETWKQILKTDDAWKLYSKKEFNSIDEAIEFYTVKFIDSKCFDVKFFFAIMENGVEVADTYIEYPSVTRYVFREMISRELNRELQHRTSEAERMKKELEQYKAFVSKMNAEDIFKKFLKGEI